MGYEVVLGKQVIGTVGQDNKINYDTDKIGSVIKEMVAGQSGGGGFFTTAKVIYRWDRNRKANNSAVYNMWKANPLIQNRIVQLNALTFGKGLKWMYDEATQEIVDRFWRINRIKRKLGGISTDSQLYGEVFIGLFPQSTGDVLIGIYESSQVDIDFDPSNVYKVNKYYVSYKDEESGKDEQLEFMPIEDYLNAIEFAQAIGSTRITGKKLGLNGSASVKGKGVMIHIKFNNSSNEIYGTSDFKQVFDIIPDYMNFIGDRLTIHQIYGSPAYDICIDTDDPKVIEDRISELTGFSIGSNPVHNTHEQWTPLQFTGGMSVGEDEKIMRGLICAGTGFPEYLLFNQNDNGSDNTFALVKIAENRQDSFDEAFKDIHKFVVAIGGGDPSTIDTGQILFPEINTMSEKAKSESYILKVGANIVSRKTAAMNMGHNWEVEEPQILEEQKMFSELMGNPDFAGAVGGRFTTRKNNQDPNRDDGSDDRADRAKASNISTQVVGNRKTNN